MQEQLFEDDKEQIKANALLSIMHHTIDINTKRDISLAIIKNVNLCILCILTIYFSANPAIIFSNGTATGILRILLLLIIDFVLRCMMDANIKVAINNSKSNMCTCIILYYNLESLLSKKELDEFMDLVSHIALDKA